MSNDLQSKVMVVINDWIAKDYMFSAFDVTKKLRHQGDSVSHWEVRNIIRDEFNNGSMGSYIRSLVKVAIDNTFVYHSLTQDSDSYNSDWQNSDPTQDLIKPKSQSALSSQSAQFVKIVPNQPTKVTVLNPLNLQTFFNPYNKPTPQPSDDVVQLTSDVRLNIGPKLLSAIGARQNDNIELEMNNNKLEIGVFSSLTNIYPTSKTKALYQVNNDSRIRISGSVLAHFFGRTFDNSSKFKVTTQSNKILVEEV